MISDGWWADQWVKWVQEKQGSDGYIGVVLDEHVYRCFSDDDKKKPQQIIDDLQGDVLTNLNDNGKGVDFIVGEYSCVLDQQSWDNDKNADRDDLVKSLVNVSLRSLHKRLQVLISGHSNFSLVMVVNGISKQ